MSELLSVDQYCKQFGWSTAALARAAGIDYFTAKKARGGSPVATATAEKIASAISVKLGQPVFASDLQGLRFA